MNWLSLTEKGDGILAAGVLCVVLGALLLLLGRSVKGNQGLKLSLTTFLFLLSGTVAAAVFVDSSPGFWFPITVVVAVWGVGILLRSGFPEWFTRSLRHIFAHTAFRGLLLIAFGLSVLLGWSILQDRRYPVWEGEPVTYQQDLKKTETTVLHARTDQGTVIPILAVPSHQKGVLPSIQSDERMKDPAWKGKLLAVAQPDAHVNCHGWVFTAGKYWLDGAHVDTILKDNGYRKVAEPQGGDLIVYRSDSHSAAHTGLVRFIAEDGKVYVESKWSWHARFVHAAEDQTFSTEYEFYRSDRKGHVLRFVDPETINAAPPAPRKPALTYPE